MVGQEIFNLDLLKLIQKPRLALDQGIEYNLYLDPEDLLVLMGQEYLFHTLENIEVAEIAERLATKTCIHQGFSYTEIRKK